MDARERYFAAAHAMQTGVRLWMERDPKETEPKHLRTGINASMSDLSGLVTLLIEKGIITEEAYLEAIADAMEREAESYRVKLDLPPNVDIA